MKFFGYLSFAMLLSVGCGRPSHQLDTAPVSGKVTLDGQPLPSGYVVVTTTKGRMASGKIRSDGTFDLTTYNEGDGAQVGSHPVVVNELPPDEFSPVPKEQRVPIPARYQSAGTSGLMVEVKPDEENYLELRLTTEAVKK
ncbi:MAG: carboxypeptidase regulatory-like domain-containing protein [Pirellulales bacterium]